MKHSWKDIANARMSASSSETSKGTDHYVSTDDLTAVPGEQWQCGEGVDKVWDGTAYVDVPVPTVGLCCLEGKRPVRDSFGVWSCIDTQPCYPLSEGNCAFNYSSEFTSWLADADCVDPLAGNACCQVVQFGSVDYWSDVGNVKVY